MDKVVEPYKPKGKTMRRVKVRVLVLFFCLALMFLVTTGVLAQTQEVPPPVPAPVVVVRTGSEPTSADATVTTNEPVTIVRDDNPLLIVGLGLLTVIVLALLTFIYAERNKLVQMAEDKLPAWLRDDFLNNRATFQKDVDQGFDVADKLAHVTLNPIDDLLAMYGREGVHKLIDMMADILEKDKVTIAAPTPTPPSG